MKKKEVLDLVESITPESETEAVEAAYTTLTQTKGLRRVYIVNAAQKTFDLKGVSGMSMLSTLDRNNLVRILLAARHGVFDFAALVFPRKTPDGKEEGTYTWPDESLVMAAIEAAYNEDYGQIDIDAMLPAPEDVGGKVPKVSFKKVCPKGKAPRKRRSAKKKKTKKPKPAPAEEAAPEEKPVTKKPKSQENAAPPAGHVELDIEALADQVAARVADMIAPGVQRSFAVVGHALHAQAHVFTALLKRQDEIYELTSLLGNYLDPEFEETELAEAPIDALTKLIEAAQILTDEADMPAAPEKPVSVAPKQVAEEPEDEAPKEKKAPPKAKKQQKKAEPKAEEKAEPTAPTGDLYTSEDLDDIDASDLDLQRVNYDETTLRGQYKVPHLKKIIEAFGEKPGTPARGLLVNRVMALAKRDGLMD